MIRDDDADLVYRNEEAKFNAVIDEIDEMHEAGRPVLVGTVDIEKSESSRRCSSGAASSTRSLNAKYHEREAAIVAQAGRSGRGHDRDEHGRPRHGHHARRQPGRPRLGEPPQAGLNPAEVDTATYDAAHRRGEG